MRLRTLSLIATGMLTSLLNPMTGPAQAAEPYIVGGKPASENYSFYTKLLTDGRFKCGATLIAPQWLVTAKHCLKNTTSVRVGGSTLHSGEEIRVAEVVAGPGGDSPRPGADFGLIKLAEPAKSAPAHLTTAPLNTSDPVRIIGHGLTCPNRGCGAPPEQLQELDTSLVTGCHSYDKQAELCVGDKKDKGSCFGDSGGPLVVKVNGRWELGGATSRTGSMIPACAKAPSIYSKVPHYKSWIEQHTGPLP